MILLIGTPCSGKSTIGRLLSAITNNKLVTLDDFIQKSIKENNIKKNDVLTDGFIDTAVKEFFAVMNTPHAKEGLVYELPYHDYIKLLESTSIPDGTIIIGLYAPYETILYRNKARKLEEQIPVKYLERCYAAMRKLMDNKNQTIYFFDTGDKSAEITLKEITTFLRKHD